MSKAPVTDHAKSCTLGELDHFHRTYHEYAMETLAEAYRGSTRAYVQYRRFQFHAMIYWREIVRRAGGLE